MSNWQFNSTRVFVVNLDGDAKQLVAKLNPFGGGSIYHKFSYTDDTFKLKGFVVGSGDLNSIKTITKSGLSMTLNSPWGVLGTFLLENLTWKVLPTVCQTLRTDLDKTTPVYEINVTILEEV